MTALALGLACGPAHARRSAFSFVLEDARGFRVDTREGTVTKDMVADQDIKIRLQLSPSDLKSIEHAFRVTRLLRVPEPHPAYPPSPDGTIVVEKPSSAWTLDLIMDGKHRHWEWDTSRQVRPATVEWDALHAATRTVLEVVTQTPEYRALPPVQGFYQ